MKRMKLPVSLLVLILTTVIAATHKNSKPKILTTASAKNIENITNVTAEKIFSKNNEHKKIPIVRLQQKNDVNITLRSLGFDTDVDREKVNFQDDDTNAEDSCACVPASECRRSSEDEEDGVGFIAPKSTLCNFEEVCCLPNDLIQLSPTEGDGTIPTGPANDFFTLADKCGERRTFTEKLSVRIAAPEESKSTSFGEFPSMALILTQGTSEDGEPSDHIFVCGASLLSPNILLTAAHCVLNKDHRVLKVRVGDYDISKRTEEESSFYQETNVSEVIVHPHFNPRSLHNDLALLVTTEQFILQRNVFPVCSFLLDPKFAYSSIHDPEFPDLSIYDRSACIATGWGKDAFSPESPYSTTLKKVDLTLVSNKECAERLRATRLGAKFILNPSFICAGGELGMDTCKGDGGGPLMCALTENPDQYIQVGVTSWGIGCGNEIPAVYASLEAASDWLSEVFNQYSVPPSSIRLPKKDWYSLSDEKKYDLLWPKETTSSAFGLEKEVSESSECDCRPINECGRPRESLNKNGAGLIQPKSPYTMTIDCENPEHVCCESVPAGTTNAPKAPSVRSLSSCGARQINGVGFKSTSEDDLALFGEFPWMVAIFTKVLTNGHEIVEFKCGGSLIHKGVVLTAAHCVVGNKPKQTILRAGEWNVETNEEVTEHQETEAAKIIIHPLYNSGLRHHDVALVILKKPFELFENVDIVCLPWEEQLSNYSDCVVTGWGRGSRDHKTYSNILKKGDVPVVPKGKCEDKFKLQHPQFKFHESWLCGGGDNVCMGDGGGPLICLLPGEDRIYQQAGIVSWGYGCGHPNPYVIYTNVILYLKWINEVFVENQIKEIHRN